MSKPDPPTPPNPYTTAAAQTGTNVSTGVANAFLNNVNQNTPQGSLNYDVTGSYEWTDPSTGSKYAIPRFTSTQSLNPTQQGLQNTSDQTKQALGNIGLQQTNKIGGMLGTPFNPGLNAQAYLQQNPDVAAEAQRLGADPMAFAAQHYQIFGQSEGRSGGSPQAGNASGIMGVGKAATDYFNPSQYLQQNPDVAEWARQTGMSGEEAARLHWQQFGQSEGRAANNTGQVQTSFGDAGKIQGADDFSADRARVEDSLMQRINPQLAKERSNIEQRLADQGIRYGSQAYTSAMDDYNRQATDTRFGAIGQAGQEQQRMVGMSQAAQQQMFDQMMGRGSFANQAQNQQFGQNAQQAGFYNQGLAQQLGQQQSGFNAQNAQRNQYMQEAYQQRNQPLNEISALMSGSQVQQPNWLNSPSSQIATTDIGGLINQNFSQQQQNYQTAQNAWSSTMGGLLGLGAGAITKSDRRAKKNIDKIGTVFAATEAGDREKLPVYEWEYKKGEGDSARHVGPMAQDVERMDPQAVHDIGGRKHIDTGRVMGSILRAA
jgi:hypothetical protein